MRREGRITPAQQRALEEGWSRYGLTPVQTADLDMAFGRVAPRHLELGFGMGDALAEMAAAHPERDYLGIEVYRPGVGSLFAKLAAAEITNVRVVCGDAVEVLTQHLQPAHLAALYVFFPDPWPKTRHHKRRLINAEFALQAARILSPGGHLHLATDWADYARHMMDVMEPLPHYINLAGSGCFAARPAERPLTKFEKRGNRLGHKIYDLIYQRVE